jgi:endonuclease/exonuclease/phosphatase family metal-dependent hydrolase
VPSQELRVVQLNAGSLLEPGWNERRHEIVAWLEHLRADIVCLQEIWHDGSTPNTAGWIVDQMPDHGWHWHFDGRPFGAQLWPDPALEFGSAVLSRWPIDSSAYHPLPLVDDNGDSDVPGVRVRPDARYNDNPFAEHWFTKTLTDLEQA